MNLRVPKFLHQLNNSLFEEIPFTKESANQQFTCNLNLLLRLPVTLNFLKRNGGQVLFAETRTLDCSAVWLRHVCLDVNEFLYHVLCHQDDVFF